MKEEEINIAMSGNFKKEQVYPMPPLSAEEFLKKHKKHSVVANHYIQYHKQDLCFSVEETIELMEEYAAQSAPKQSAGVEAVEFLKWVREKWIVGTGDFWRRQKDYRDQRTDSALVKEYNLESQQLQSQQHINTKEILWNFIRFHYRSNPYRTYNTAIKDVEDFLLDNPALQSQQQEDKPVAVEAIPTDWRNNFDKYFSLNQVRTKEIRELLLLVKHWISQQLQSQQQEDKPVKNIILNFWHWYNKYRYSPEDISNPMGMEGVVDKYLSENKVEQQEEYCTCLNSVPLAISKTEYECFNCGKPFKPQVEQQEDKPIELWGFFYNSCIHESSYAMMSLHWDKESAEKAMNFHKEEKEKQYNERYKDDEHFKKSCPFAQIESWIIDKVKIENQ